MSTLHGYQFRKKGETRNYHKVKTWCFGSINLYNPFTHKRWLEAHFEISDGKIDTKDGRTKNTNIKKYGNYGNCQVAKTDVETVDITEDDSPQGFLY